MAELAARTSELRRQHLKPCKREGCDNEVKRAGRLFCCPACAYKARCAPARLRRCKREGCPNECKRPEQLFCCRACSNKARRLLLPRRCKREGCVNEFQPRWASHVFCNSACYYKAKRQLVPRQCKRKGCPNEFQPANTKQVFCCKECFHKTPQQLHYKTCDCGATITSLAARCRECSRDQRRAREWAVAREPVNAIKVFERDNWRCQICMRKTPKRLRGKNHPRAPHLDHRIPLSKDGSHTYENVQCSCQECNLRKGNRTSAGQLPMFDRLGVVSAGSAQVEPTSAALA